ncbi:TPA: hypothetical protein GRR76_23990 [Vibrio parahaemolyticus]|nr:hypothetical protein [Vibrio parahaemolyticus]HAS6470511.1 hypothetical protein [Vibrio parahaemolyticus]
MEESLVKEVSVWKEMFPILASLITATATLIGVYIANVFNQKSNLVHLEQTLLHNRMHLKVTKIEEVYDHFSIWESHMVASNLKHHAYYMGVLTEQEFYSSPDEKFDVAESYRKFQSLVALYFPEASTSLKNVIEARDQLSGCFFGTERNQKACDELSINYKHFEKQCAQFKSTLAFIAKNL